MNVVLLGSGNVATHFGKALVGAGHRVVQVFSRNLAHASLLAEALNADAIDHVSGIDTKSDIYIIAVKDDAIEEVALQLPAFLKGIVVHTAGSMDIHVFATRFQKYGVVYPVQTFSKSKTIDFSTIPIAVEASDDRVYTELEALTSGLSQCVFPCSSVQRLSLHVAAVFACNFTNHLYAVASDILQRHHLAFDLIRPLILETAEKVMDHEPRDVQTGPAIRRDESTIRKHLALLVSEPDLSELYASLSDRLRGDK